MVVKKPLILVCICAVVLLITFSVTRAGVCKANTTLFSSTGAKWTLSDSSWGETELKYYMEDNLSTAVGVPAGQPVTWQSAIRLTQMEMAPYMDWTMTKVNVAFYGESACESIDVRIYVYDTGTSTHPGTILVNDTTYTLNTTGVTTIPLVTPVNLSGHEELWVAVAWHQVSQPGNYYAWLDTLTGPAIDGKGDWAYFGSSWSEIQTGGPDYDGNWGIGAIVEGFGLAELSIGNIRGPIGIQANLSSIGEYNAENVSWSIAITGGLFHRINATATGTLISLAAGSSIAISVGVFFGFGKILIVIAARAENTLEVTLIKNAFLLGLFVVGIR